MDMVKIIVRCDKNNQELELDEIYSSIKDYIDKVSSIFLYHDK